MSTRDPVVAERWALAVLRVSLGVFLLMWGIEKFVLPDVTVRIWSAFYGVGLAAALVPVVGALESALALGITVGLWRRVTYGMGLLLHAVSVAATFLAGVPVLAAFVTLYLMRDRDTWTLDERLRRRSPP